MTGDYYSARGRSRALRIGLSAILLACAAGGRAGAAAATGTPCEDMRPPELEFRIRVEPAEPVVDEVVEVEVQIVHATLGYAGIPLFQLVGAEPWFAIEAQENSYPLVEFARYRLRAAQPGATALQLRVNFETFLGCVDLPLLVFQSTSSPAYPIAVRGDETTATATPTPTATPLLATPTGPAITSSSGRAPPALRPARTWAASPRR